MWRQGRRGARCPIPCRDVQLGLQRACQNGKPTKRSYAMIGVGNGVQAYTCGLAPVRAFLARLFDRD